MIGEPRPAVRRANRQSSIRNHQSQAVYEYDVYGQPAAADPGHPNPFAFTGRRFDPETGLYYYRARYYNPTIGRFLQTDPIGYEGGSNLYRYCQNNALRWVDPSGADPYDEGDDWTPYYQQDSAASCLAAAVQNLLHELMLQLGENWRIPPEWVIRSGIEMVASDQGKEVDWNNGAFMEYALPVINEFLQGVAPDLSYRAITPIVVKFEYGGIWVEPTWGMTDIEGAAECGPVLLALLNHAVVYAETVATERSGEDLPPGFTPVTTEVIQHRVIDSSSGTDTLYYTYTIARWLNSSSAILVPNWW
jgi:RHS repeat-associated protein